jgi:oligopeptide/dipeptide ABC transporter ATP-binding protein
LNARLRLRHVAKPFRQATGTAKALIVVGAAITLLFVVVALAGPALSPFEPTQYRQEVGDGAFEQIPRLADPSAQHPMGTNRDSFDVLARVIGGARVALAVVLISTVVALGVGVPLGLLSGYRGGRLDRALVTAMDAIYIFPPLLLAIVVAFLLQAYLRPGVASAAAAVGIVYIPQYFRVVRNHTLSVKEEPFVEAAKSLGAPERTVITRYVFFNVVQSVPVIFTLNAADAVLTLASLGFLGYGVPPPAPEWGYDISQAIPDITSGIWWTAMWPGLAIVALVTGLTLVGEGLNDVVNPLLRARGMSGAKLGTGAVIGSDSGAAGSALDTTDDAASPTDEPLDASPTTAEHDVHPPDASGRGYPAGGIVTTRPAPGDDGDGARSVLQVRELRVGYRTPQGPLWAVDGVNLDLREGEALGLVGESGCGKSSLSRALLNLMPPGGRVDGEIRLAARGDGPGEGELDLVAASRSQLRGVRGNRVGLVFQEPMTRLDPLMRVSDHFVEAVRAHRGGTSKRDARDIAEEVLTQLGIPPTRIDNYPHEFSGGMRQRIMIALAIVLRPQLILADEPTTSLDVIVEAQILDLLDRLRRETGAGLLLVTHNLGIVAETCDRIAVMYAGKVVEVGPVDQVFAAPAHPYTQGLLASTISLETTELHSIGGSPPDLVDPPPGCRFAARCPHVMERCREVVPTYADVGTPSAAHDRQYAACLLHPGADPAERDVAQERSRR